MSSFDQWLTTDTAGDAAEAYAEHVDDQWCEYAESQGLPYEISDEDHPEHAIYTLWEALFTAVVQRQDHILAEEEWAAAEAEEKEAQIAAIEAEEQMVLDSMPCVVCERPVLYVPPSAERAWCWEHA